MASVQTGKQSDTGLKVINIYRNLNASLLPYDPPQCRKMSGGKTLLRRPQQKHRG